jgi:hypothetical protein
MNLRLEAASRGYQGILCGQQLRQPGLTPLMAPWQAASPEIGLLASQVDHLRGRGERRFDGWHFGFALFSGR